MTSGTSQTGLAGALRQFEAAEANLEKLERLWQVIASLIPVGIAFGSNAAYDDRCRAFENILEHLPKIDGWSPEAKPMDLNEIAQARLDAQELGEISCTVSVEEAISAPGRQLEEYRFRFHRKRRQLVREAVLGLCGEVDEILSELEKEHGEEVPPQRSVNSPRWDDLRDRVTQIETLLGSSVKRPPRWSDLARHLRFGQVGDLRDILQHDWPTAKPALLESLHGSEEPVPVDVYDLGELASARPRGAVPTELGWDRLSEEDFERLIFGLVSGEEGYENPQWLTRTRAPDRGRDISVLRIVDDRLAGVTRSRVIIQCKHWMKRSVSVAEVSQLREQMKLWEPPRVDVCVIATTGRFTTDAVELIEKHNASDSALRIEMWPDSHLELLLAARPALIAEFSLR